MVTRRLLAVLAFLALASTAWAHKPFANDGTHVDADHAIFVEDVGISQVVYHKVTAESPRIWLSFDGAQDEPFYIQVGVPVIEGLDNYRPAYAILGPGLPKIDLPFPIPEGYGGWLFDTTGTQPFDRFYEPFTGTESWRFQEQNLTLPDAGRYYVVAYVSSGDPGKFWAAVGTRESFTIADILALPRVAVEVRQFHEVSPIGGLALNTLIVLGVVVLGAAVFML